MSGRAFLLLYLACLGLCVGAVQGARAAVDSDGDTGEVYQPEPVAVAIPPKPEGARDATAAGAGEGTRYDEATCAAYQGDFRDVCFHALARQRAPRDLAGALGACDVVARKRLQHECRADVAELHVPTDLAAARGVCPTIPVRKWHDQCFFGIAMALVSIDPRVALAACDDAGIWRDFCRHDTLGEASVTHLELVLEACGREEGDLLTRKTCWHGIGKYIGRVDLPRAVAACQRVPLGPDDLYRENCVHGIGWAAGERYGAAGIAECAQTAPMQDSCRLGVAFQVLTSQPDQAVELCQGVERADLRRHCLEWVGGR
ncbi:MAG: hypothetical protein ABIO70_37000 [Pseudomonadota bacterium]